MLGEQMNKYLHIKFQDHWYPERPTKGSAYRSIRISKEKIDKIIKEHVIGGNVVEEYVIPKEMWAEAISPEQMRKMAGVS